MACISLQLDILATWVKPVYLNVGIQAQVRAQFEKSSQISLPDFIVVSLPAVIVAIVDGVW